MNYKCNLCFYEWKSRVEIPAQCPRCKRYDWNKSNKDTLLGGAVEPE